MNRKSLISALAGRTRTSRADAERNVLALLDIISGTLESGGKVTLSGFGVFEVRQRAARNGRNPKTGQPLKIEAARVPAFRPGIALKTAIDGSGK